MQRILVPCDFSEPAQEAFRFAVQIAQQSKGEIHVLHVVDITFPDGNPTLSYNYAFNANFLKEMERAANEDFHNMWQKLSPRTVAVKFVHQIGSLVQDVENYVNVHQIDTVIMGTSGGGQSNWSSNTERIVRNCKVPVFAIRKCPDKKVRNIVIPLVPDHKATKFIDQVRNLQVFFNAATSVLWVNTPAAFKSDPEARTEMALFARRSKLTNFSLHLRADYTVEEGVLRFANDIQADVIAMGTHAHKGLIHWFTGSITEEVVNHSHIPIWTLAMK